jgi:YVTN family beta-propeller protein
VTATIPIGGGPAVFGVAVAPDGSKVYVANDDANTVSVIATATNTVSATIPVGSGPDGVAVTPDGSKVYVANANSNNVSVIATTTNMVIATIPVGVNPVALGVFIQRRNTLAVTVCLAAQPAMATIAIRTWYSGANGTKEEKR